MRGRLCGALALLAMGTALATAPAATAAPQWHDGNFASTSVSCLDGFGGSNTYTATQSYTGFYADANNLPQVGDFFYVHNVTASVAPSGCPGFYEVPEFVPPPGAQLAITGTEPVFCWVITLSTGARQQEVAGCPQQPEQGTYGHRFPPTTGNPRAWPLPPGKAWEIQVPMRATKELKGMSSSPCDCVKSPTWIIGAVSPNWVFPEAIVFVNDTTPTIVYPSDASTQQSPSSWRTKAQVNTNYTGGKAVFDIGTTTAYGTSSELTLDPGQPGYIAWEDWTGLAPGTTYHWRIRYLRDGKAPLLGADQTFTTAGSPPSTPGGPPSPTRGAGSGALPSSAPPPGPAPPSPPGPAPAGPSSAPPLPAAARSAGAPATVSLAKALTQGIPVTVSNSVAGLTDEVTLYAGTVRASARRPVVVGRLVRRKAPKGRVVLKVKPTRAGLLLLRRTRATRLTIRVRVSGPGVAPSTFTRFARLRR